MKRREFLKQTSAGLAGLILPAHMFQQSDLIIKDHPSRKRRTRPNREATDLIVLHTTEAPSGSSLNSLTRGGNANYMVDRDGVVYRIMDRGQVSIGAGRSMWDGRTNLDNSAINIEFVGYHNKEPTEKQFESGRKLIAELQRIYPWLDDNEVLPHSMVAYGAPNKWHRESHRGRKRCGMLFAQKDVRKGLGLDSAPEFDPDVRAGRLSVADPFLEGVLYAEKQQGINASIEKTEEPEAVISTVGKGESVWTYAGNEFADSTTTYFLPNQHVRRGDELSREGFDFSTVQPGTQLAVGYVYGGHLSGNRSAYQVAGKRWNLPSTIYRLPDGEIKTGDDISESSIPAGTLILFRR